MRTQKFLACSRTAANSNPTAARKCAVDLAGAAGALCALWHALADPENGRWSLEQGNEANEAKTFSRESWPRLFTRWVNCPDSVIRGKVLVLRDRRQLM